MSFTDTGSGYTSATPVWGSYVSLDDAKRYLQYPAQKDDQDDLLESLIDTACWWAQDYCGRPFAPTEFQYRFDGWAGMGGAHVMLPFFPVLKVVNITEWWGTSGGHVLSEQTPQQQFGTGTGPGAPANTYQLEPTTGRVIRTFPGLIPKPFFPGSRNVEVQWVAGYNPIPPPVRFATLELFAHLYRNTQEQTRISDRVGSYGQDADRDMLWPAVPNRVTVMLEPYVQMGIG